MREPDVKLFRCPHCGSVSDIPSACIDCTGKVGPYVGRVEASFYLAENVQFLHDFAVYVHELDEPKDIEDYRTFALTVVEEAQLAREGFNEDQAPPQTGLAQPPAS